MNGSPIASAAVSSEVKLAVLPVAAGTSYARGSTEGQRMM